MRSLYESILDTDDQIQGDINKQADKIKYIRNYVDLVKKELGKYIDKKASQHGLFQFLSDDKTEVINRIMKLRDKKIPGFEVQVNGKTNFYVILKDTKDEDLLWFEWNYFDNGEDGWMLVVGPVYDDISNKQTDLQKYAEDLLKKKLL